MKELSDKEKAKRYDEAINKAKSKIKNDKDHVLYENDIIEIFPELKESEDERIKNGLVKLLNCIAMKEYEVIFCITKEEALSWIEKQGEPNPYSGVSFKYNGHTWGMCARDNGVDILLDSQLFEHLKKQGEQKPVE